MDLGTFLNICKLLTVDTNGDGIIDQYGMEANYYRLTNALIYSNNGSFFKEDANGKFILTLTEENAMPVILFASALINSEKVVNPKTLTIGSPLTSFRAGKTPMCPYYGYEIKYHDDKGLQDDAGIVNMPTGPKVQPGSKRIVLETGRAAIFSPSLKGKEDVIPVICDALSVWDERKEYYVKGGKYPSAWDVTRRPEDTISERDEKFMDYLIKENHEKEFSMVPYLPNFLTIFQTQLKKLFDQQTTIGAALEAIRVPLQAELDEFNLR